MGVAVYGTTVEKYDSLLWDIGRTQVVFLWDNAMLATIRLLYYIIYKAQSENASRIIIETVKNV